MEAPAFPSSSLRKATIQDLEALVMLEESCFTVPWSKNSIESELRGNPFSHTWVFSSQKDLAGGFPIIGYCCFWIVFEEIRFLNVAILQKFRRQGLATQLLVHGLTMGVRQNCSRGMLEVRQSNIEAIKFYKSLKFKEYARRKSYYTNPVEDAILMIIEPIHLPQLERTDIEESPFVVNP